ncbi:MAG: glycosyltransferase family 2 protein [Phycisphaerae bacterium]|jgi:glycosyltransferase involved in cell wall biosynthesis
MHASIIITTFRRPEKLAALVRSLASQDVDDFEVLVTVDGVEPDAHAAAREAWAPADPRRLVHVEGDRLGPCAARNRAIERARGDVLIFFNDDVVAAPDCVRAHLEAHRERADRPAIIVGDSPWKRRHPDSLFARMLRDTSMVFFHHRMRDDTDRERDWGFRHAWLLNLSAPAASVRAVGGLRVIQKTYGRDDDELAFRMTGELGMPVLWRPEALVTHDHPMSPVEYLAREHELGVGAVAFALGAPACAQAMFGRDVTSRDSIDEAAALIERGEREALALRPWFLTLDTRLPNSLDPHEAYERHLPLKRWCWRQGYLRGAAAAGLLASRAAA